MRAEREIGGKPDKLCVYKICNKACSRFTLFIKWVQHSEIVNLAACTREKYRTKWTVLKLTTRIPIELNQLDFFNLYYLI